jgi:phytanoyl-CoA hydroxylase
MAELESADLQRMASKASQQLGAWQLQEHERAQYDDVGYFVRTAQFAAAEVEQLQTAAEAAAKRALADVPNGRTYWLDGKRFVDVGHITIQFEHHTGAEDIKVIEPVHQYDERFAALMQDPRLVTPIQGLLGQSRIALWTDKLNLKRPAAGSAFGWHQDSPYWTHDCDHVDLLPKVMVSFDDASVDNGCLRVIPGSHRQGCLPGTADGTQLGGFYTSPDCFDETTQVALEVPAGSLIFFNPHIIHGSQPNHSAAPRRAIVITYQPGDYPALKERKVCNLSG